MWVSNTLLSNFNLKFILGKNMLCERWSKFDYLLSYLEENNEQQVQLRKLVRLYGGNILLKQSRDSIFNWSNIAIKDSAVDSVSYGMNCHLKTIFNKMKKKLN